MYPEVTSSLTQYTNNIMCILVQGVLWHQGHSQKIGKGGFSVNRGQSARENLGHAHFWCNARF